jgi:uncharacterized protein (UPF0303 family)
MNGRNNRRWLERKTEFTSRTRHIKFAQNLCDTFTQVKRLVLKDKFALIGEHVLLKEKEQLWVKLVSILLAIGGAILIQLRF